MRKLNAEDIFDFVAAIVIFLCSCYLLALLAQAVLIVLKFMWRVL